MTDRVNAIIVTLDHDIREDDAEALINAIRLMRRVIDVRGNVAGISDHVAQVRARQELGDKLWQVLYPKDAQ